MAPLYSSRIVVLDPLTAVYELDGSELLYKPKNLVIWDSAEPKKTTPAVVSYSYATLQFQFKTDLYDEHTRHLEITRASGAGLNSSFFAPEDFTVIPNSYGSGVCTVPVQLKYYSQIIVPTAEAADGTANDVPWASKGISTLSSLSSLPRLPSRFVCPWSSTLFSPPFRPISPITEFPLTFCV